MEKKDLIQIHLCDDCVHKFGHFGCGVFRKMELDRQHKICYKDVSTEKYPPREYIGHHVVYCRVIRCLEFKEKQHD